MTAELFALNLACVIDDVLGARSVRDGTTVLVEDVDGRWLRVDVEEVPDGLQRRT